MRPQGALRRLPYTASPARGESLASWVDRTAAELDLPRRDVWLHLGLIDHPQALPVAYGVALEDSRRRGLKLTTGLDDPAIDVMLLCSYAPAVVPWDALDLSRPAAIRMWSRSAWVFARPSHACSRCVHETGGVWMVSWKLPWTVLCEKHRTYLISACATCGGRLQGNALDRRQQLQCCAAAPEVAPFRQDGRPRTRRRGDDICGDFVGGMPVAKASNTAVALQRQIDDLITRAGDDADAAQTLSDIRRLATLVLYLGVPDVLPVTDAVVRERFAAHVVARDATGARRGLATLQGYRQFSLPIIDPLLAAGAFGVATRLAFSTDPEQAWQELGDAIHAAVPDARYQWSQLTKFWTPPERHVSSMERARDRGRFVVSVLDGRTRRRPRTLGKARACHVPALLWPSAFAFLADGLLEEGWSVAARHFASFALVRHLQPGEFSSWELAAAFLGVDRLRAANAYRWMGRLRQRRQGPLFERRLAAIAEAIGSEADLIDYAERRACFLDLVNLPPADWHAICADSGIAATSRLWAARRPQAATWVWETVTGGDWHNAPALGLAELPIARRRVVSNGYVSYFKAKHLIVVQRGLHDYAAALLRRRGLSGPVTMDPKPLLDSAR